MLNRQPSLWSGLLLLNLCFVCLVGAQPLGIRGISDRGDYANQVTFLITNTPGFSYAATLDGSPVPVGVDVLVNKIDYHELSVWRTNTSTLATSNRLVRFIVYASERSCCEAGLPTWTPYPSIHSAAGEFAGARLKVIAPQDFPAGLHIPVVAWVEESQGHAVRVNGNLVDSNLPPITIRRGVGSALFPPATPGVLPYSPQLPGLNTNKPINIESSTSWTPVSGTLSGNITWPENSRISVTTNITIPAGSSLTIGPGTVVRLASRANIHLSGQININGTLDRPVIWTPFMTNQPWGGIFLSNASQITATGTIWTGSGADQCFYGGGSGACAPSGAPGSHRGEQSLFHFPAPAALTLTDCAAISLAGQFGHYNSGGSMNLDHVLIQRVTTGGEYHGGSIAMNDCALIEVPADTEAFADRDNDGMYLSNGGYSFTNCLIGWTKDDGMDSGGSGSGPNNFINCWFESSFHEGISGSGSGKLNNIKDSVFINCGQAYEAGYSGVTNAANHVLSVGNLTGARFGDNYFSGYSYTGFLSVTNSILLYNYRNVWGMTLNRGGSGVDTNQWVQRLIQMNIRNNYLSAADTNFPNNNVWNPAEDGERLAAFLNMPPNSPVGMGLAIRNPQLTPAQFANGVPVRLSRFAVSTVSVEYVVDTPSGTLASGTLQFVPGETVKQINLSGINLQGKELVRVALKNPAGGELTSISSAYYVNVPGNTNTPLVASGSAWKYRDTGEDLGTTWRTSAFSDAGWSSGPAQLGFGDNDEATPVNGGPSGARFVTTYFRQNFNVASPAAFTNLSLWMLRDDGGVVYINGNEVYRSPTMPQPPTTIVYGTYATNLSTTSAPGDNSIDTATISATNLVAGVNLVAVEIHQFDSGSSDSSFDFSLTGIPVPARPRIGLARFDNELVAYSSDSTAVLEEASSITGPWTPISGDSNPLSIAPGLGQKFYRLRK